MTRSKTIKDATTDFIDSIALPVKSIKELNDIADNLFNCVNDAIEITAVSFGKKWAPLKKLSHFQIGALINKIFTVRNIDCQKNTKNAENKLLGIYVDELVLEIVGDEFAYCKGIYSTEDKIFRLISREIDEELSYNERIEVIQYLGDKAKTTERCDDPDLVAVNNGIFNYKTKELLDFDSEIVFLAKSQVNYNHLAQDVTIVMPDGEIWSVEEWFKSLAKEDKQELVDLFWEITSALLRPNVRWNKSAWLYSEQGNNGKGTLCEMWRLITGVGTYASIPLSDFGKDFALEPLTRSTSIIVDENDVGTFIDKAGNLKAVITNDVISINRKFKTPIDYQFRGFMVQCLNEFPRVKDKSDSFYRRQMFIPMEQCFTGVERPYIKNDYLHRKDVLEYILYKALNTNFYQFTVPSYCNSALNDLKAFNNPVRAFWYEFREQFTWDLLPYAFLYDLFKEWYKQNYPSGTIIGKITFNDDLRKLLPDDMWSYDESGNKVRAAKRIVKPEPLICEYGLTAWMSKSYKGADVMKLSTFVPTQPSYLGITRVGMSVIESEEESNE